MPNTYGGPISKENANRLFKNYAEIKKRAVTTIVNSSLGDDKQAMRYYCGRMNETRVTDDLCFVFDRESLERLMEKLNASSSDGIVIFNGSRDQKDSPGKVEGTFTDVDGRPTLMMFPFKYENKDQPSEMLKISLSDGEEHPGTGTGSGGGTGITTLADRIATILPDTVPGVNIHALQ